tara:strand:- start:426 stop:941 length:516 start_codon:yes stop_codon:yes gene_type:complete
MISDNLLRDDIDNGLSPKGYLDQNINKSTFLTRNTLMEQKSLNNGVMQGYSYLYETKSMVENSFTRYTVFFDIDNENKKPKAWIFIKKFNDISNDNKSKVIDETFDKMSKEEIENSKGLRVKVIRFRDGMSYQNLASNSPLGRYAEGKLRLLNGHYPTGEPKIGSLIKIVE